MKKTMLFLFCIGFNYILNAQYSVSQDMGRLFFCNPSSVIKETGKVQSFNSTVFKGFKYHFYYYSSGVYSEIGYYAANIIGTSIYTSYGNLNASYFDGSQIGNATRIIETSSTLWLSIDIPYAAFPNNNTGQQLVVDVEAIDQFGSTTTHSSKTFMSVPLLYTNPVTLSSPGIEASSTVICSSIATLFSNPNYSGYGFTYDWYKDGTAFSLGDNTGTLTVGAPGNYYAIVSDACQTATSSTVAITSGTVPGKPTISLPALPLCNGASGTMTANGSGGTYTWSTGTVANTLSVIAGGNYTVHESNGCGAGPESDPVTITTASTAAAPIISSSNETQLCNGASTTLTSSGTFSDNILWFFNGSSTGHFGTTYTISAAGSYTTKELSACGTSPTSNAVNIITNSTPPVPGLNVSGTILLCDGAGQTISSSPTTDGGVLHWSTGATGNSITVTSPGNYYAWETNPSCGSGSNSATVTITTLNKPFAPVVNPPTNQLLCNGAIATLTSSGSTIKWSNGTVGNTLVIGVAGNYYSVDNNACGNSANSNVVAISTGNCPIPAPGTSFFICPGKSKLIDAGPGYDSYAWNTGATTQTITVGPGTYSVTVMKQGCSATSATVTVSYYSVGSALISASGPTSFCAGNSVTLSSSIGSSYLWSNGATSNSILINASGSYSVTVTDGNGCQATSAPVTTIVNPLPNASISGSTMLCQNSSSPVINFTGSSGTAPYTFNYKLNNGTNQTITTTSGNSISMSVPTNSAGTFAYNLLSVSESSGTTCLNTASGSATVVVNPLPSAVISGTTTICQKSASPSITFTGNGATLPYTFTYKINGGSNQTITTISGNSISIPVPTSSAGLYTYSLISVQESSGTACSNTATGSASVLINPLPTATIAGNNFVCQNSAQSQIIFTGNGGTQPYTFSYKINGGSIQTISTVTGNAVAINVPTNTAETFVYTLVSVQESSGTSCVNSASGNVTVVVNPLPTATIAGSSSICQNSSAPSITFTGSGATAPYKFTYKINGGANQTVTTTSGNSVTVSVPTSSSGIFTYSLISVQESGVNACVNTASGSATVTINQLATATIAGSANFCQNSPSPLISFTGSGGTAPYTFTFKINGGANQTVSTTAGNTVSISAPTNAPGTYVYSLVSVLESSGTTCSNAVSGSATITVNPLPTATIAGTTSVCQYSTSPLITFTGSGATAPYTFSYKINNGTTQKVTTTSGNSIIVSVPTNSAGTYTYTLISVQESNGTGCMNSVTGSSIITVNPQPVKASIAAPNHHLCNGDIGIITVTNYVTGFTYTWYKDGVLFRTTTLDTIHISVAGNYTVMANSDKGCDAATVSDPVNITTGTVATPVITGYLHVCPQGKTRLAVMASVDSLLYDVWKWTEPPDKKLLSGGSIFSALAGQYRVWVSREGCADSVFVTVRADDTVYPAGKLTITPIHIPYGGQIKFIAEVSNAVQYLWDLGYGNIIYTPSNTIIQNYYTAYDSLPIQVKAISERNCITNFNSSVKVDQRIKDSIPDHSFTGNLKDWNVFPIPFHNELKVSVILKRNETVRMDLFTMDGRWTRSWQFSGKKGENLFQFNKLENLPANVFYLITAVYNSEKHFEKLFKY